MCVSFLDEYLLNHERTERPPLRTIRTEPTLAPPGCGTKSYICYIFPDSLCTAHTVLWLQKSDSAAGRRGSFQHVGQRLAGNGLAQQAVEAGSQQAPPLLGQGMSRVGHDFDRARCRIIPQRS